VVREQLALALNRVGQWERAESVAKKLLERRGPSPETYGILGRVYKDQWEIASADNAKASLAQALLVRAIDTYLRGFEADWRDVYPGINAVTLMESRDPPDPRRKALIPIVAYGIERRLARSEPTYWDFATQLELALLMDKRTTAKRALEGALGFNPSPFERASTVGNLKLICSARAARNQATDWIVQIIADLQGSPGTPVPS
jgi:hypothetical protein